MNMPIKKLPQHLINKLKAGEIVERPASLVKELLENALDAWATALDIRIEKWGKQRIMIRDNGVGMTKQDLKLSIERYATSKIASEHDFFRLQTYGFRGEALASIAEVSSFRMHTRTASDELPQGLVHELWKDGGAYSIREIVSPIEHGTTVIVENLFATLPARKKFLKTDGTEWGYIQKYVIEYALVHWNKSFILSHNGEEKIRVEAATSLLERIGDLFMKEWSGKVREIAYKDEKVALFWLVGDASLHFPSSKYVHCFVNGRPVQDKVIKRAIMDAYQRQIVPGSHPFACVFLEIDPALVDVNVHPRKTEVKFMDPSSIFTLLKETIKAQLWWEKVNYAAFRQEPVRDFGVRSSVPTGGNIVDSMWKITTSAPLFPESGWVYWWQHSDDAAMGFAWDQIVILGQLRESFIVAQGVQNVYYIDQHALAERITFEKMRVTVAESGFESEWLLHPLSLEFPSDSDIDEILKKLSTIGFDIELFGEWKVIVQAVPKVFAEWKIDSALILQWVWGSTELPDDPKELFRTILDEMLWMKACKASIKAGQKLSMPEMKQLLEDWMHIIDGLFVCQHGRPSVVKVEKKYVEALFDRH